MNAGERPIIVYCPSHIGGIAEHAHYQATELVRRGFRVEFLCNPHFLKDREKCRYRQNRILLHAAGSGIASRLFNRIAVMLNGWILACAIAFRRPQFVLLDANSEYLALSWIWPHLLLRALGTTYVTNFHDPVRARHGQAAGLHDLAVALVNRVLAGGLIHGPLPVGVRFPQHLVIREAPFGPYSDLEAFPVTFDARKRHGIPADARLLLAFGHVADRKNFDLIIEGLRDLEDVHLLVAGGRTSSRDRPASHYTALAASLGVDARVHWYDGFVAEAEIPAYFAAADMVALTYRADFVSDSGVAHLAAQFGKPIVASGGDGPLRATFAHYDIGVWIEPDSVPAIVRGIGELRGRLGSAQLAAGLAAYRATFSWRKNVETLLDVVALAERWRSAKSTT